MRCVVVLALVMACEAEPIEKLSPPPTAPTLELDGPRPPTPLPPRPPPRVEYTAMPVPRVIAEFLRAHATDSERWRVSLYALGEDTDDPRGFLGGEVLRSRQLNAPMASEVLAWLGSDKTFVDETGVRGCGWEAPELGIEIARGSSSLRMRYNCGYVFFDKHHKVSAMVGSDGIVSFQKIEARSGFVR